MATADPATPQVPSTRPRRRVLVTTLVVVASILSLFSIMALWANRQVLNTDNWASSSSKLPPGSADITILKSKQLKAAQDGLQDFKGLTVVLLIVTLALFATAVAVAGRRREALRSVGIGLICAGVAAFLVRTFAGTAIV